MMQIINAARESDVRYAPDRGANPCMDQISSRALTTQHTRTQLSLRARMGGTHHSRLSKKRPWTMMTTCALARCFDRSIYTYIIAYSLVRGTSQSSASYSTYSTYR
jgi:hypothetical protein